MYQTLLTALDNGIFSITINRPDKLNALNKMVFDELNLALDEVESNAEIRSVYITGSGEKAFVAGADIGEFGSLNKEEAMAMSQKGQATFFRIENSSKPIIAAVNGFALGGGCELAMACHFRVASDNARFGQPEVNLGLIPGYGGTQRLTQLIGKGRAIELLITANMIDAASAFQFGLVNYVVPQAELLNKTTSLLQLINSKAPIAVGKCIECANLAGGSGAGVRGGFAKEVEAFGECFATEDKIEGAAAFLGKRKAQFKGK
jgi:enoyl-CoA hydratase